MKKEKLPIRNPYSPLAKKRKGGKHHSKQDKKPKSQDFLKEIDENIN